MMVLDANRQRPRLGRARESTKRRLATVLFVDIVDSTGLATRIGDRRWRELLARFRRTVRTQLGRHGGVEQDTAGDGFFATFAQPDEGVRAAVDIVRASQAIGVEVRAGVHTGECDVIDGRLGGVAAHIGARICGSAQPAQVLTTTTVRDIVVGSHIAFADAGVRELKGVPGTWQLLAVTALDGQPVPVPMGPEQALQQLESSEAAAVGATGKRRRRRLLIAAGAGILVIAVAVPLATTSGGRPRPVAAPQPPALVQLNPTAGTSGRVVATIEDPGATTGLWLEDGQLWRTTDGVLERRDPRTGRVVSTASITRLTSDFFAMFHSLWAVVPQGGAHQVQRLAPDSGHIQATTTIAAPSNGIGFSNDAAWDIDPGGTLRRIDPTTGHVTTTLHTGIVGAGPGDIAVDGTTAWIATLDGHVYTVDLRTGHAGLQTDVAPHDDTTAGYVRDVPADDGLTHVWFIEPATQTMLCVHNCLGFPVGSHLGLAGAPAGVVYSDGLLWVAAGHTVQGFDPSNPGQAQWTDPLPRGMSAGRLAALPNGNLWMDNCDCSQTTSNGQSVV